MRVPVVANGDVKTLLDMDQTGMACFHYFNNMEVHNNEFMFLKTDQ